MTVSENGSSIILENESVLFTVGRNGNALSLIDKKNNEELLSEDETSLFSVTQDRFFDNELKLMYPSGRISVPSDSIRFEDGCFIAGFSPLPYEAVIRVSDKGNYFVFTLSGFLFPDNSYRGLSLARPPAVSMRFLQLKLKRRKYFGRWMNVCHDERTAAAVMGTAPHTFIGNKEEKDSVLLFAEARKGILFEGCSAILAVGEKDTFLKRIEAFEEDFGLPQGVKNRRNEKINASAYWVCDAVPDNIEEHISLARRGGFSMMLFYYTCFIKEESGYGFCGNYELRGEYKNGFDDIRKMLELCSENGITPGLHFLHSHIGIKSRYFTPEADHRIMHRQLLTLSEAVSETDTVIYTDQIPLETVLPENCRILRFGTELISFSECTESYPYCYKGCIRGYNGTKAQSHPRGEGGGVVFMSEFGASSGYCDQNSSLQDETAEKIADIYNLGFKFVYFDGSEGVNAPYEFQIPFAQYRVYKKLCPEPIFTEAAAKGHFSWHMMSGGNAFDVFPTDVFKAMINKYPLSEASEMRMDFTRINFGWWSFYADSRPDVFEYGLSRSVGFDCPVTIQSCIERMKENPRNDNNLEVFRRWEYVRLREILTDEQKEMLRQPDREFILLKTGDEEYVLQEYDEIKTPAREITVHIFERNTKACAVLCHNNSQDKIEIPLRNAVLLDEFEGSPVVTCNTESSTVFTLGNRTYLKTELSVTELADIFKRIRIL